MKNKIKILGVGLVALVGLFAGADLAAAQTAPVVTCSTATVYGRLTDTGGSATSVWFEWGTTQSLGYRSASQVFNAPTTFSQYISGLNENTTYYYRAMFANAYGSTQGSTLSFTTPSCNQSSLPTVTTNSAGSIAQNSATLNGYVVANGSNVNAWFEYGTTQSFGNTTNSVSYGNTSTTFSGGVYNLAQNTTYYYRAVAQNSQGTVYGSTLSFTTTGQLSSLPSVTTNGATNITQNSATLNGYVVANGSNVNAWFEWGTTQSLGNTTNSVSYGNTSTSYSNAYYNFAQNTTYYYRAVAQNAQGTVYGSILSFTTTGGNYNNGNLPSVSTNSADVSGSYAALNGYVNPNYTSDTVRWFEWGTTQSLGYSTTMLSQGTVASMFSAPVTNLIYNTTYYYRAVARNSQGTVYGSILSFTTTNNQQYNTGYAPTVTTLLATEISGSTARLNGLVFASNNQSSNAWFEWGTSSSLGSKTQTVGVGSLPTVKHSDYISGLTAGQTYYYRIVAENSYGKEYGVVNSFVAQASTQTVVISQPAPTVVYKPVTTVVTQGSATQSLVTLSIDGGAEMITSGEKRTYHVKWKNVSAQTLGSVVIRVSFSQSMNVDSATKGAFSSADNSVVIDLKTLAPNESGETFIFATAGRNLKAGEILVTTANMVFTGKNGVQGDAIAYVTHTAQVAQSALGASVFGAGDFTPTTLLGWMSLLVLVLIMVYLGNHLYGRFSD